MNWKLTKIDDSEHTKFVDYPSLVQNGKEVKLDDLVIKTITDIINLNKTTLLTAVQSAVFFYKKAQGKK